MGWRDVAVAAEWSALHAAGRVPVHFIRIRLLKLFGASIASGVVVYHGMEVRSARRLVIGERSIIGNDVILDARGGITIGSDVNFSTGVHIWTEQHDPASKSFGTKRARVEIGDRAWLSDRCVVLPGVKVGEGAVVAAGAVVVKDVQPYTMVGGIPAMRIADRPGPMRYRLGGSRAKLWWW